MNQLTIIGNLTRDPVMRTTPGGANVCKFGVAVNRRKKSGEQEVTDYFEVSAWREQGENCSRFLSRGKKVCVVGPVSVFTYFAADGSMKAGLEINAQNVEFLSPRFESPLAQTPALPGGYQAVEDDELPF